MYIYIYIFIYLFIYLFVYLFVYLYAYHKYKYVCVCEIISEYKCGNMYIMHIYIYIDKYYIYTHIDRDHRTIEFHRIPRAAWTVSFQVLRTVLGPYLGLQARFQSCQANYTIFHIPSGYLT